jgi:hypothetical protein
MPHSYPIDNTTTQQEHNTMDITFDLERTIQFIDGLASSNYASETEYREKGDEKFAEWHQGRAMAYESAAKWLKRDLAAMRETLDTIPEDEYPRR